MHITKIDYKDTGYFPQIFIDYINGDKKIAPFYNNKPDINNFKDQIKKKEFSTQNRKLLFDVLKDQYAILNFTNTVKNNLYSLLKPTTYTLTTGHQCNIFLGPLYFIYKLISVINAANLLNKQYPEYHFVPVYWMASEDHDFLEINHFYLFGNKYHWKTDQKGAVGRFNIESIRSIFNLLPEKLLLFEKAYNDNNTLSEATRYIVNELFGEYGLIIIDPDDKRLKKKLKNIIIDDLQNHTAFNLITRTSNLLKEKGYKLQVNPRNINFFYLNDNFRERIVKEEIKYKVLNSDITFTEKEIFEKVATNPESFSPNVVTRPLYQELILPNLVYVGGPAEIAYWLQLKTIFEQYKIPFPVLLPRNSALWINNNLNKKLNELKIPVQQIFSDIPELKKLILAQQVDASFELKREKETIHKVFKDISMKADKIDKSKEMLIQAGEQKVISILDNIEKKLQNALESKYENQLNQIKNIKEKLFPNRLLQERRDNFLNFYINDPAFLETLLKYFDPFDFRFQVFEN